jgi:hypothetical protein
VLQKLFEKFISKILNIITKLYSKSISLFPLFIRRTKKSAPHSLLKFSSLPAGRQGIALKILIFIELNMSLIIVKK